MSDIMYVFLWLTALNMMMPRPAYVVANGITSFFYGWVMFHWFPRWCKWWRILLPMQEMQEVQIQKKKRHRFHPWVRSIPWRRKWQPTPVFLAWKIPWTEEPGRLQSMESQRVRHNWACTRHSIPLCTQHVLSVHPRMDTEVASASCCLVLAIK